MKFEAQRTVVNKFIAELHLLELTWKFAKISSCVSCVSWFSDIFFGCCLSTQTHTHSLNENLFCTNRTFLTNQKKNEDKCCFVFQLSCCIRIYFSCVPCNFLSILLARCALLANCFTSDYFVVSVVVVVEFYNETMLITVRFSIPFDWRFCFLLLWEISLRI